jgi:DNA-binding transcriptional ArsR family regulator
MLNELPERTDQSKDAEIAARIAYALAHPVRLEILALLRDEGAYVMHLTNVLNRRQAYLSQHLAVLREAGLVVGEREGTLVRYRLASREILRLLEGLQSMVEPMKTKERGRRRPALFWLRDTSPRRAIRGCRCPRCCR